jgi:Domain of unknown function (DUF4252)
MSDTNPSDTTPRKRNPVRSLVLMSAMLLGLSLWAPAQDIKLPADVQKLSAKAKETVEVNMEGPMLRWASKFLNAEDPEEKQAAKVVANLRGIYVRSFEFSEEGEYSAADVESLRSQVHAPGWTKVVGVRSETDGDNVDVFFKLEEDKMAGIVIISAEPKELTFVSIVGPIDVDQLADLGGEFGIPKLKPRSLAKKDKGDPK